MDSILLAKEELWPEIKPSIILQLGGRLTSKRTQQFLEWSAKHKWDLSEQIWYAPAHQFWILKQGK